MEFYIVSGIIIFVLFLYLLFFRETLYWKSLPSERYPDLVAEFGKPDILSTKKGGLAIWYNKYPYTSIILTDEEIPHCCPKPHYDFLTSSVCVTITDPQKLKEVLSISKSIWYDQLKGELYARCHFMGANVATLVLATRLLLTDEVYSHEQLQSLYKDLIMSTMDENSTYDELTEELKRNLSLLECKKPQECEDEVNCETVFA